MICALTVTNQQPLSNSNINNESSVSTTYPHTTVFQLVWAFFLASHHPFHLRKGLYQFFHPLFSDNFQHYCNRKRIGVENLFDAKKVVGWTRQNYKTSTTYEFERTVLPEQTYVIYPFAYYYCLLTHTIYGPKANCRCVRLLLLFFSLYSIVLQCTYR